MKKLLLFMLLSVSAATSTQAGDSKNSLRDALEFCNQFIITDPNPALRLDYHRDCCINGRDAPWRWWLDG